MMTVGESILLLIQQAVQKHVCELYGVTAAYYGERHQATWHTLIPPARLEASWEDSSVICESKWWTTVSIKLPVWVKKTGLRLLLSDWAQIWSVMYPKPKSEVLIMVRNYDDPPFTLVKLHDQHDCSAQPWRFMCYYSIACLQHVYYFIFMSPCSHAESLHEFNYCIDTLWTPLD